MLKGIALPQPQPTLPHPYPNPTLTLTFWLGVSYYALSLSRLVSSLVSSRQLAIYSKTSITMIMLTLTLLIGRLKLKYGVSIVRVNIYSVKLFLE